MKNLTETQLKERSIIIEKMIEAKGKKRGLLFVKENISMINALAAFATD